MLPHCCRWKKTWNSASKAYKSINMSFSEHYCTDLFFLTGTQGKLLLDTLFLAPSWKKSLFILSNSFPAPWKIFIQSIFWIIQPNLFSWLTCTLPIGCSELFGFQNCKWTYNIMSNSRQGGFTSCLAFFFFLSFFFSNCQRKTYTNQSSFTWHTTGQR